MTTVAQQLAHPSNFVGRDGRLYLVRCVHCGGDKPSGGTENWAFAVYDGRCAWCGWNATEDNE